MRLYSGRLLRCDGAEGSERRTKVVVEGVWSEVPEGVRWFVVLAPS